MSSDFFVLKKDMSKPLLAQALVLFAKKMRDHTEKIFRSESSAARYQLIPRNFSTPSIERKTKEWGRAGTVEAYRDAETYKCLIATRKTKNSVGFLALRTK